jgi:hypothetical protein
VVRALLPAALIAILASVADAQDTTRVAPGDRVLVTAPSRGWKRQPGVFVGFRGDSLVLWGVTSPVSEDVVAFHAVRSFLVNHGNQPARSWALEGTLAGAVAGLTWGSTGWLMYPCETDVWLCDPWHYVGSFVVFGAALGGIAGAVHHVPPYRGVKLRPRVDVAPVAIGQAGLSVGFHLSF